MKKVLVVRVTDQQYKHVQEKRKKIECSEAELIREYIEQNMNPTAIFLPLAEGEKDFLESVAEELGVTLDQAIRLIIYTHKTLMQAPLGKIVKPMQQILAETTKEGKDTEYFEEGK